MKRFLTILALATLVLVPAAMAQGTFGWSVSNSSVSANSNTGAIAPDPANPFAGLLYLWLNCSTDASGMSASEFDLDEPTGGVAAGSISSIGMLNGFLNAGPAPANAHAELLIAVGGCPNVATLAAQIGMGPDAFVPAVDVCIVNSNANNRSITIDCATGSGNVNDFRGFSKGGVPCESGATLCPPVSVEAQTWGSIKGLYR